MAGDVPARIRIREKLMGVNPNGRQKPAAKKMHRAARIEDHIHRFREGRARRHGHNPTVLPYPGYGSTEWVRVLCRVVMSKPVRPGSRAAKKREKQHESVRGWRSFTSVHLSKARVRIRLNGYETHVTADRGGVVDTVLKLKLKPGVHTAHFSVEGSEDVTAEVQIISPRTKYGLISDVDDTVMVTALPRPFLAAWNSFVLDEHARVPTPGMAVFLRKIVDKDPGMPVMYLSTGAWNVAPTLRRFLGRNLYPSGALLLTDWGPTPDRMFRSGRAHKEIQLKRLAKEFPKIKWILVGDDGQHDESIYAEFEKKHPLSVAAVAIRRLSPSEAVLAGSRRKPGQPNPKHEVPWAYAPDGAGLVAQLKKAKVL